MRKMSYGGEEYGFSQVLQGWRERGGVVRGVGEDMHFIHPILAGGVGYHLPSVAA